MSFQSYCSFVKICRCFCLLLGIMVVFCASCSKSEPDSFGPSNSQLVSTSVPERIVPAFDLKERLVEDFSLRECWFPIVRTELLGLSEFIDSRIKKTESQPTYEAPALMYSGINRENAQKTYTTSRVEVSRWRYSKSAPSFETGGLQNVLDNMYQPWAESTEFRTELTPASVTVEEGQIRVTVIAHTFGEVRENVGLQSTSMWMTSWKRDSLSTENIELTELKIVANEEVLASSADGVAFRDITANVLQHDEVIPAQLNIGIDEWAKSIPGVDITGNLGLAIGDPNGDGFEDIYLCQPAGLPNILLSQNPDGTADSNADVANINLFDESRAALFVDLDNDDDEDLVVSTGEELLLFSNNGSGEFILERKLLSGHGGGSISAADYDNDGNLDLYISKYNAIFEESDLFVQPNSFVAATSGGRNVLLKNEEGWEFTDVTAKVGLKENNAFHTRCGIWCDYDLDGDQDLMLANEYGVDVLYENREGWFSNVQEDVSAINSQAATRSASVGDLNGDGRFDFFLANNFHPASNQHLIQPKQQDSLFGEIYKMTSQESRVLFSNSGNEDPFSVYELPKPIFATSNSFGSAVVDINNDGFDDLLVTNGLFSKEETPPNESTLDSVYLQNAKTDKAISGFPGLTDRERFELVTRNVTDQIRKGSSFGDRQRNVCLLSMGTIGFANISSAAGVDFPDDGRAIVSTDWDHDGDLDLVVSSRTAPMLRILGNQLETENQFVEIQLKGTTSNRDAIGARVELYLKGRKRPLVKAIAAGSGMLSQSSKRLHFGIPKDAQISGIIVYWPHGEQQRFEGIKPGTRYRIVEGQAEPAELTDARFDLGLFKDIQPKPNQKVAATHCLLNPPMTLPRLEFQSKPSTWVPLKTINEMRMVVLFVDDSEASSELLTDFAEQARDLADEKIDVVAIYLNDESSNSTDSLQKASDLISKTSFPFRFGSASESMLLKTELLYGEWFSQQRLPQAPFGWIVDRKTQLRVVYPCGKVTVERVENDLATIGGNLHECLDTFSMRPGYWANLKRVVNYSRLGKRFEESGFERDKEVFAELSNEHFANQLCRRAIELEAQGDSDRARNAYAKAMDSDPHCVLACVEFGNLLLNDSRQITDRDKRRLVLDEAKSLFNRVLRIDPTNTEAILGRAQVFKNLNKLDLAIEQLKEFLAVYPERWEVHAEIGRIYFHKQEFAKSTQYLLDALNGQPNLKYVAGDLGVIYLYNGRYQDAKGYFQAANRLQPSNEGFKKCLAQSEFLTGNFGAAIELLEEMAELTPNDTTLRKLHAWVLATSPFETQRDGKKSLEMAQKLLKIFDDSVVVLEITAAAYAEISDFENAIALQQKAVDLIDNKISTETYNRSRIEGMNNRLQLYKRQRPYRMSDLDQIPIPPPGLK